jgi:hypothetical protein
VKKVIRFFCFIGSPECLGAFGAGQRQEIAVAAYKETGMFLVAEE